MQRHREPIKCISIGGGGVSGVFQVIKMCTYIFLQKSQLSILGNLSCKLCSASRGGASLHKYNFLLLYTFALQRIKQVISICLQAILTALVLWTKKVISIPFKIFKLLLQLSTTRSLYLCATYIFMKKNVKKEKIEIETSN